MKGEYGHIHSPHKPQEKTIPSQGISMVNKPECNDKDFIDDRQDYCAIFSEIPLNIREATNYGEHTFCPGRVKEASTGQSQ
jgi:hypothetical protein